ncbi:P-loop containing nucleoside triphosphate hydrolase protein [Aspergillus avenaceus]|uniref:P-loop containing nucleoside triphosphate hydrolase protein n=1 Tax=Aspergillus avenaceus TaxID=36643 RepID=A0A5N6TRB7_ASPAV|nr:P-loop containing nucleoside triphosphate hydrolase protein [Aspergillus avenaceus]
MSPSSDDQHQALYQLQSKQSKFLDQLDELREIGVGELVERPQLVVCGNESIGKSSMLELITGVRLHGEQSDCSRFVTELVIRRSAQPKFRVSIEPGASRNDEQDRKNIRDFGPLVSSSIDDLPALTSEAEAHMTTLHRGGLSDDVLKIEISGPGKPELVLVELPRPFYPDSDDSDGKVGKQISVLWDLKEKYMSGPRTILLSVVCVEQKDHPPIILNMAKQSDPEGERTLAVFIFTDKFEAGSEEGSKCLRALQNEKMNLPLGWHALCNHSVETRGISHDARGERERVFFKQGRWASIPRDFVGIDSLRHRISNVLLQHVRDILPGLVTEIREKIVDREQKLAKLGSGRITVQQQRGFLLIISNRFERITSEALNGMYTDEFFGGFSDDPHDFRRLRAVISELNDCFADAMILRGCRRVIQETIEAKYDLGVERCKPYMDDWSPEYITREALVHTVKEQARKNRGIEFPGSTNQLLVGSLFRDQSKPWEAIARRHLMNTWESAKHFSCLLLQSLTDQYTYSALVSSILAPELEKMKKGLLSKLGELTTHMKRGHPLPLGVKFVSKLETFRRGRQSKVSKCLRWNDDLIVVKEQYGYGEETASGLPPPDEHLMEGKIIDQMQAHYAVSPLQEHTIRCQT